MAEKKTKEEEPTIRTSIILPRSLYLRLGAAQKEDGVPATEVLRLALAEYLERREKARKKGGRK